MELFDGGRGLVGPLLIAEESLSAAAIDRLGDVVRSEPSWSDFPILILTTERSDNGGPMAGTVLTTRASDRCAEIRGICGIKEISSSTGRCDCCQQRNSAEL
jgi:hypothetical protein